MENELVEDELSLKELVIAIILYPRSTFKYCIRTNYVKYILLFFFLDIILGRIEKLFEASLDWSIILSSVGFFAISMGVLQVVVIDIIIYGIIFISGKLLKGKGKVKQFFALQSYALVPSIFTVAIGIVISLFGLGVSETTEYLGVYKAIAYVALGLAFLGMFWTVYLSFLALKYSMQFDNTVTVFSFCIGIFILIIVAKFILLTFFGDTYFSWNHLPFFS